MILLIESQEPGHEVLENYAGEHINIVELRRGLGTSIPIMDDIIRRQGIRIQRLPILFDGRPRQIPHMPIECFPKVIVGLQQRRKKENGKPYYPWAQGLDPHDFEAVIIPGVNNLEKGGYSRRVRFHTETPRELLGRRS